MSIANKLKSIPSHLPHGTAPQSGLKGFLVDKGERYAASAAFGVAKGYYGDRFIWKGYGIELWTGAALTIGGAIYSAMSGGKHSSVMKHVERIGDAGMSAAMFQLGASWGADKAGRVVQVLTPGKNGKGKKSIAGYTVGAIAPAAGGPYLSDSEIASFSGRRV